MPRQNPIVNAFTAGELSPRMEGREDLAKYFLGASRLTNWEVLPQGPIQKRGGSQFIMEVKDSSQPTRVLEFQFSIDQNYIIEAGDRYFRFYTNRGRIEDGGVPVEVVTPYLASEVMDIQFTQSADILYLTHPNHQPRILARSSDISWTLDEFETTYGPFEALDVNNVTLAASATTGSGITITSSAPVFQAGHVGAQFLLFDATGSLPYASWVSGETNIQNGDIRQVDGNVYRAVRAAATTAVSDVTNTNPVNVEAIGHGYASGRAVIHESVGGTIEVNDNVYYADVIDADNYELYLDPGLTNPVDGTAWGVYTSGGISAAANELTAGDITPRHSSGSASDGEIIWEFFSLSGGIIEVTGFVSDQEVVADVLVQLLDSAVDPGTTYWAEGSWSDYRGWPRCVAFFEQRLFFGGTANRPQTIWGSAIDDYQVFTSGDALDSDPVEYTIASRQVNTILWMVSGDALFVGTARAEWIVTGASVGETVTPTSIRLIKRSEHGSTNVVPVEADSAVLFVQRGGRKVRELRFEPDSVDTNTIRARDLTILAEHITRTDIVDITYQQEKETTVRAVLTNGDIVSMVYQRDQDLFAWYRMQLANNGTAESIASIPSNIEDDNDEMWMVVQRTVNGSQVRYIELLRDALRDDQSIDDAFYVDSGLTYNGVPTQSVSGLDHLVGETVAIVGDGAVQTSAVVALDGTVNLEYPASIVHIGLGYDSDLLTLPLTAGAVQGSSAQGVRKRVFRMALRLLSTVGLTVYTEDSNETETLTMRSRSDMDQGVPPFSGVKVATAPGGWEIDKRIGIKQEQPLPATIVSYTAVTEANT